MKKHNCKTSFDIDLNMIAHKFSDFYNDDEVQFRLYDAQKLYYPYLIAKVSYTSTSDKKIHQIELSLLELINKLASTKYDHSLETLKDLTKLDNEVFDSFITSLHLSGYINLNPLSLTRTGKDAINGKNIKVSEEKTDLIKIDAILGNMEIAEEKNRGINIPKDSMELKPKLSIQPRTECLNLLLKDNKTLRTCVFECLRSVCDQNLNEEVWEVNSIERIGKIFNEFVCLFYINQEEERILAIDSKTYEKDEGLTNHFKKILEDNKIDFQKNKNNSVLNKHEERKEFYKQNESDALDFTEGASINVFQSPKYLKYALREAKKQVCIQSPWVTSKALEKYTDEIEGALKRGVKVYIKYGIDGKKSNIDEDAKQIFQEWKKYPNFRVSDRNNSHAKILIFDEEWVITGSFNWLSFGKNEQKEKVAEEDSTLIKNYKTIKEKLKKF